MIIHPHVVLATEFVADNRRASTLIGLTGLVISDSLVVVPRDSGQRSIELYTLVREWGQQASLAHAPARAIVLTAGNEGGSPRQAIFYSTTSNAALRPSVRITYIPKIRFGIP